MADDFILPSLEEAHEEWKEIVVYNKSRGMRVQDIASFPEWLAQTYTSEQVHAMLDGPPVDVMGVFEVVAEQEKMEEDSDHGEECA